VNLVADESVDRGIVEALRAHGFSVAYIAEMAPSISDELVLELAKRQSALLLTSDKDFGELVYRQQRTHNGVLLLRLEGLSGVQKAEHVLSVFQDRRQQMVGAFSVLVPGRVRIRTSPIH
jgi:predicted nuclease of predicted toxin-antitoxin system